MSTTTVQCIKCDFCHATSDFCLTYKCYGCEKDICGDHAVCEDFPAGSDNCIFLCGECSPSFDAANDAASDIVSEASEKAERIMKDTRVKLANQMIREIATRGRKFFYSPKNDRFAQFIVKENGRLYFVDDHNGNELPLSHCHSNKWRRYFSHGGTLKDLILALADFIQTGSTIHRGHFFAPQWVCGGDPWGYGSEMSAIQSKAEELGIIPRR